MKRSSVKGNEKQRWLPIKVKAQRITKVTQMRLRSQGYCWALATLAHLSSEQRDSFQVLRLETRTSTGHAKPCLICLQTNCFPQESVPSPPSHLLALFSCGWSKERGEEPVLGISNKRKPAGC